jgi:hypothetical protein
VLYTDPRSRPTVDAWAQSAAALNRAFVTAITKLVRVRVKTGPKGTYAATAQCSTDYYYSIAELVCNITQVSSDLLFRGNKNKGEYKKLQNYSNLYLLGTLNAYRL